MIYFAENEEDFFVCFVHYYFVMLRLREITNPKLMMFYKVSIS